MRSLMEFSVLVPEETVNYVTNPAMRYDTTGWNAQGATITRTLTQARFGIASLQVVTAGSALREGCFFRVSSLSGVSEPITVSVYVRGTGKVRIRLDNNVIGGAEYASQPVVLRSDRWQRVEMSGFSTGGNDLRLFVETDEGTAKVRTFYVDGAQMERKVFSTTYCDGEQDGCRWNGLEHGSTSQRTVNTRAGGKWFQLAGEEREEEDLYMTVAGGLGNAPITNMIKAFSEAGGGYFENVKIEPRLITLTFHAKLAVSGQRLAFSGPPAAEEEPVSLGYLHQLRQTLIDLVKPDLTGGNEDIWFKYQDGSLPLYFQGRYDGGLTGEWDIRNQFINSFPLRLLCMDPMVREDNQEVAALDFQNNQNAGNFNRVAGRINGEWSVMNYGMDGTVGDLELGSKGEIFAAGSFNDVNHKASAIAPFVVARFVAYWDGTRWYAFGNGAAAGTSVNDMAIAPNGDVYVTGLFSSIGGVAANNIAKWNGTTWSALGTGLDFPGLNIAISPNGIVYVGGQFTIAGGVAAFYIAKWDGATWRALGQFNGLDSYVQAIAITPDGKTLYIGGQFDDQNTAPGSGLHRICLYDVDTDRFSAMGAGVNANVLEVILSPANILYIGGDFFLSGATTINRIGAWVGNAWVPLGIGMDDIVYSMDIGPNGDILAVGAFLRAGGVEARHLALWNGSTWTNLDIEFSIGNTALILLAVQYNSNGDIFVGGQALPDTPTLYAKINTIDNQGSAESFPVVYVAGPGQLRWLENQTNQKRIFFDLFVFSGEEVIIDFAKGTVESTVRGSLLDSVLPGSDFQEFTLLPGLNKLAVFMLNDVNAQMQIAWTPRHWGVDVGAGSN